MFIARKIPAQVKRTGMESCDRNETHRIPHKHI